MKTRRWTAVTLAICVAVSIPDAARADEPNVVEALLKQWLCPGLTANQALVDLVNRLGHPTFAVRLAARAELERLMKAALTPPGSTYCVIETLRAQLAQLLALANVPTDPEIRNNLAIALNNVAGRQEGVCTAQGAIQGAACASGTPDWQCAATVVNRLATLGCSVSDIGCCTVTGKVPPALLGGLGALGGGLMAAPAVMVGDGTFKVCSVLSSDCMSCDEPGAANAAACVCSVTPYEPVDTTPPFCRLPH
jgi:hypothetical protein